MPNAEGAGQPALLVEVEATLPRRHLVDRRPLDEDDLRGGIGVPCQRPVEFAPVVAVDENEVLPARHEVERIDPLPRRGDEIALRSEEHTSELQSLMRTSSAFFCL